MQGGKKRKKKKKSAVLGPQVGFFGGCGCVFLEQHISLKDREKERGWFHCLG